MIALHWGTLLLFLLAAVAVEPLFGYSLLAEVVSLTLFILSIVGAVFASARTLAVRFLGTAVALIWFVACIATLFGADLHGAAAALSSVLVVGTLSMTFSYLVLSKEGNLNTLLGAIFGYLLLTMAFAMLFIRIERWHPGSFEIAKDADLWSSMLYYSLVTMTTLGYGDILPATPPAQMAAGFEAVFGVLYIAVMIGSIVGSYRNKRNGKTREE